MKVSTSSNGRCWGRRPPTRNLFCRFLNELSERLRLRRGRGDTSEDDEGLPHSPCNSPTVTESPFDKVPIKDHAPNSHSTCSDGSLLSMGSSDTEEDSIGLQPSRHSSKVSLYEKKTTEKQDSEFEIGLTSVSTPLNHAAAHHRVAVRPKRTHGAPRKKNNQQLTGTTLPTTPEVNEEWPANNRSVTPESKKEILSDLNASMSINKYRTQISNETRLKCSSLPPGLARPEDMSKLSRSQSSVGSKPQNSTGSGSGSVDEVDEEKDHKSHSIFGRFFPRRSGKKKKTSGKSETVSIFPSSSSELLSLTDRPTKANLPVKPSLVPRTGPASRQRVQPIDIPASPEFKSRQHDAPRASPEILPLQQELQNHFKNHLFTINVNEAKPPRPPVESPQSPKSLKFSQGISSSRQCEIKEETKSKHFENREEFKARHFETKEEYKNKSKIAGLSSLQQGAIHLTYDSDEIGFKSLTDLPSNETSVEHKLVAKSHSFKGGKTANDCKNDEGTKQKNSYRLMPLDSNKESLPSTASDIRIKYEAVDSPQEIANERRKQSSCKSDSNESINSINSNRTSSTEYLDSLTTNNNFSVFDDSISHKAVVSVCCNTSDSEKTCFLVSNIENENSIEEKTESYYMQTNDDDDDQKIVVREKSTRELTSVKEQQTSVTKVQVKQTCNNNNNNSNRNVPEFLNIHLNKVDPKPTKNIVLTANLHSPKTVDIDVDEEHKLKSSFNFEINSPKLDVRRRRFSREEIEIFEKDKKSPTDSVSSLSSLTSKYIYKKNADNQLHHHSPQKLKKCSEEFKSCKSSLKNKSNSLEIVDCIKKSPDDSGDKSLQSSLDKLDCDRSEISNSSRASSASSLQNNSTTSDGITYRRKSFGKQRKEDEPELMKVFARRSLKIKDEDEEMLQEEIEKFKKEDLTTVDRNSSYKSRDSDKENQLDSPLERRKLPLRDKDPNRLPEVEKIKDSFVESKVVKQDIHKVKETERATKEKESRMEMDSAEVIFRKPINNKFSGFPRSTSLNMPRVQEPIAQDKIHKHSSFAEKSKTERNDANCKSWINIGKKQEDIKEQVFMHDISPKSDFVNEDFPKNLPKNFIQRKAEWEKRAQEALKKKAP